MKIVDKIHKGLFKAITGGAKANKTSKNKPNKDKIVAKIIKEAKDLSSKDIKTWRDALESVFDSENPNYSDFHDLVDYLKTDGHLNSQIQIRKLATLSSAYNIIDLKTGKENIEKTEMFKSSWFYNFIDLILESIYRGYEVLELVDVNKLQFSTIPYRNIVPEKKLMLFEVTGEKGIKYDDPKLQRYIIEVGEVGNLGILNNIVPQLIWKKNAQSSWAEYAEKFGMPFVTATTNKSDTKTLDMIENQLADIGENFSAIFPEGTTIDIKESSSSDSYNVYDKMIERTNSEISKQILGGTMVSDNGSSKSQSEVHERTLDNKIAEADRRFVEFLINDKLIPLLNLHGFGFNENDKFVFDRSQNIPLKEHWGIVKEIITEYEIPQEWISKTFKIPINGRKDKNVNFKKPQSVNASTEANNKLRFPNYPKAQTSSPLVFMSSSYLKKDITSLQNEINKRIYNKESCEKEILEKAIKVGKWLRLGLFKGWGNRRLNIDYKATDNKALAAMEYNLFHFSFAREMAGLQKLNSLLINKEKLEIRSFEDFVKAAEPFTTQLNKTWLETEYQFAIATGQSASSYNKFLSEKDTVTKYVKYQTAGDNAVRDAHAILDGRIFSLEDPDAMRLNPPNGWKCRCEFVQYISNGKPKELMRGKQAFELLGEDIETIKDRKGNEQFYINRGDTGQVFTKNQMYIKDFNFGSKINNLNYKDYNLKDFDKIKDSRKNLLLDKTITDKNVKELFKKDGTIKRGDKMVDVMQFQDYLNRNMTLNENIFKNHTKGHYLNDSELRHQLFPHIKEVLANPDEVYFTEFKKKKFQTRHIKFYKDKILCVDSTINNNNIEISTWYSSKKGNNVRKGLMIK